MAFALLIGPLAFGRISTLADFDYQAVAVAAVDGFLKCFAKEQPESRASSSSEVGGHVRSTGGSTRRTAASRGGRQRRRF
jgi:hypothetical protein